MSWRRNDLSAFGHEVTWLEAPEAWTAFRRAVDCTSKTRYGLNAEVFPAVERLDVDEPRPEGRAWLASRVGSNDEPLLLVFGRDEVSMVRASFFLDRWQDLFCPSRDDVVILPRAGGWALFYCHEDEFEFAYGGPVGPVEGM